MGRLLSDVGESGFHELVASLYSGEGLPALDDCGSVRIGDGFLLLSIDGFAAANSKPWCCSWFDWGWKAVAAAISDVVAKAGRPLGAAVSVGFPRDFPLDYALEVIEGAAYCCDEHGLAFLGGDTNASSSDAWIDAACIGWTRRPVPRRAAKPEDAVIVTGKYGVQGALFHSLSVRGIAPDYLLEACLPRVPVEAVGVLEDYRWCVHACIDVSDGLAHSLALLAKPHGIAVDSVPLDPRAEHYAREIGVDAYDLAFHGGEEYQLAIAVEKEHADEVREELRRAGVEAYIIGYVVEEPGVWFRGVKVDTRGWDHFRSKPCGS